MLKLEVEEIPKLFYKIFQKVWDTKQAPEEWKYGIIKLLAKPNPVMTDKQNLQSNHFEKAYNRS